MEPTVEISAYTARLALEMFEDILTEFNFRDIAVAAVELREVLDNLDNDVV